MLVTPIRWGFVSDEAMGAYGLESDVESELSLEMLELLTQRFSVLLRRRDGKLQLALDVAGKSFQQR